MKQALLLLSILMTFNVLAQIPDYFANDPRWREDWDIQLSGMCIQNSDNDIYVDGDTTMSNGVTYRKLMTTSYNWLQNFGEPFGCDDAPYYSNGFYSAVRQSGDSIFMYQSWDEEEVLAIHYNFQVGDTLQGAYFYDNWLWEEPIHIIGIDSIETMNGMHRRFSLSPEFESSPEYMVEGIGHHFGFLNGIGYTLNGTRRLVCYRQNGVYQYGGDTVCSVISSISELSYLPLTVFPNPVNTSAVTIESDGLSSLKNPSLGLYSLDGKESNQIQILHRSENQWRLYLDGVESGVYLLKIISEEGIRQTKLIIE